MQPDDHSDAVSLGSPEARDRFRFTYDANSGIYGTIYLELKLTDEFYVEGVKFLFVAHDTPDLSSSEPTSLKP